MIHKADQRMKIQYVIEAVNEAKPEVLAMSRKNCHQHGLHSIVVAKNEGRLDRFYLTDPDHQMGQNHPFTKAFSLGVHNHKYDLSFHSVIGQPEHLIYREIKGTYYKKYRFTSAIDSTAKVVPEGRCDLHLEEIVPIGYTSMKHDQLHTVFVPKGQTALWWVFEGNRVVEETTLITNAEVCLTNDLYESISKEEILDKLEKIMEKI